MSPDDIDVQILETEILLDQTHAEVWFDRNNFEGILLAPQHCCFTHFLCTHVGPSGARATKDACQGPGAIAGVVRALE